MRLHPDAAEQDEDDEEGQGRDEGGQAERAGDGFHFLDVHGASPDSAARDLPRCGKRFLASAEMVVSATTGRQWSCTAL